MNQIPYKNNLIYDPTKMFSYNMNNDNNRNNSTFNQIGSYSNLDTPLVSNS